jgi:hypothetical protein
MRRKSRRLNYRSILAAAITVALCGMLWFSLDGLKLAAGRDVALAASAIIIAAALIAAALLPRRRQR